ncbi:39S ribosomal protein L49, mitochondrial-like [Argiope bruennichi]|nr:39S ribosomal protein L49, mitochondrial-like [Argiope bruennichi]
MKKMFFSLISPKTKSFEKLTRLCLYKWTAWCTESTRAFDPAHPFRIKKIPEDIWAESKDPKFTGVEEVKDRWHFVERLFPKLRVPEPAKKISSVGWKAPSENLPDLPYFIERTRNHMLPVYEDHVYKDRVRVTQVKKIQGDIWAFEVDLKKFLQEKLGEEVESHVNEMCCFVNIRGRHVDIIKEWLYDKGF